MVRDRVMWWGEVTAAEGAVVCNGGGGFVPRLHHPRPHSRRLCLRLRHGPHPYSRLISDFVRAIPPSFVPSYGQCGVGMGGCGGARARHRGGWTACRASLTSSWRRMRWPGVAGGTCGHRGWCDSDGVGGLTCVFPPLFLSVFFLSFLPPILTSLLSSSSLVLGLARGTRQPVGC